MRKMIYGYLVIPLVGLMSCEKHNTNSKISEETENIKTTVIITCSVMAATLLFTYITKRKP